MYGDYEIELDQILNGYEDIREIIDHAIIYRVDFEE